MYGLEGLPMPIERRRKPSAARMAKRTSGEMAWAIPAHFARRTTIRIHLTSSSSLPETDGRPSMHP